MPPTVSSLDEFIATASQAWNPDEQMRKHTLPTGESVHCALWKGQFYITGTDIVRVVKARFYEAGIPIPFLRKFEEGIFSDLRNLKPGVDAVLELPRSEFLDFLFANGCIRTQKKQKVFLWSSVRHNMLFQV
ncbi:transcription factor, STE-like protein [Polychytrium aggregatum]|uniref:transcription factor, STE-like protein n=1 Tax=Polychytrium aggregatum TaxID=110093 RepID=UPI0022FE6780|nr:transcription factor, STE-like protein [Polychytrium aggregatum]KAI9202228.1 transcription factor, STE-like protein [Polychytrium aggregatum]